MLAQQWNMNPSHVVPPINYWPDRNRLICSAGAESELIPWEDGWSYDAVSPEVEYLDPGNQSGGMNGIIPFSDLFCFVIPIYLRFSGYRSWFPKEGYFYQGTQQESYWTLSKLFYLVTSVSSYQETSGQEMNYFTGIGNWTWFSGENGFTVI